MRFRLLAACVSLTADPRALIYEPSGIKRAIVELHAAAETALAFDAAGNARDADALDPQAIRVLTWNIHKQEDAGWQEDLTRLAKSNDVLLLQEVTLQDPVQEVLRSPGCAGSWPARSCTKTSTLAC